MPELPEVETTRRGISPHISGQVIHKCIVRNGQLRWPVPVDLAPTIEGQKLLQIDRRGKYLVLAFSQGAALWHLGMSGSLRIVEPSQAPGKHDHVDWQFSNGSVLRYHDPRRFGALLWTTHPASQHPLLSSLGPEPLSPEFDGEHLFRKSRGRAQAIKTWLMDAKVVVGVGNIYANEALFSSGIHPLKAAGKLSKPKSDLLADNIKNILSNAIERGGTTLRDFVGGDGKPGYFAQELNVYGRGGQGCRRCAKPLTEKRVNQRTTVYCVQCQK